MLQDMVLAAVNEALRSAQELAAAKMGGHRRRPRRPGRAGPARAVASPRPRIVLRPPVQRLITELGKLPGIGNRTAQRLAFHILRASKEDAYALADAIREVKEQDRPLRGLLQPRRGPALHDLRRRAPRPGADLRRRGARAT